jgi:putative spermidine/putrescine transport system permease protein
VALLAAPLAFLSVAFLYPLAAFLYRGIDNSEIAGNLPETAKAIAAWDQTSVTPGEDTFAALVKDLAEAQANGRAALLARYLNYRVNGFRSLIMTTAEAAPGITATGPPYKDALIAADPRWSETTYWQAIARDTASLTPFYFLEATDLERGPDGRVTKKAEDEALYVGVLGRTLLISSLVTLFCLLIAYPIAYLVASSPPKTANRLMIFVLLPFWSSLLIRSTAWVILLQEKGPLNDVLLASGLVSEPVSIAYTRWAVYIAMTDILLPFMALPIYSTMKGISPHYVKAAISLGATPFQAFRRVYLPLSLPGVAAGCLLVFVLALGYYITPDLVGGRGDQMLSWFVAQYTNKVVNWGLAAALGSILFVITILIYLVFTWRVGVNRIGLE